ncbi:Hypothetical protein ORPV_173 [Orpheovirus IHUMI-LCC2]|uniref:F-box domain-containing protein n=1 Tax=Orpheovirus IHUMI-LCC2 TaxID=2023057 RepID=A0A2I2L3I5_9VIRU|nr:Hypothetical protein ORPV_173 [Orpheovirus IHUMI-LCC2]SNW62077.1 Hypothetical protein ORPV_173 [Orpheovirus IHUMI-LCC2]
MECNVGVIIDLLPTISINCNILYLINIMSTCKSLYNKIYDTQFWKSLGNDITRKYILQSLNHKYHSKLQISICKLIYNEFGFVFENVDEYWNMSMTHSNNNIQKLFSINCLFKLCLHISSDYDCTDDDDDDDIILDIHYIKNIKYKIIYPEVCQCLDFSSVFCCRNIGNEIIWPFSTFKFNPFFGKDYKLSHTHKKYGFTLMDIKEEISNYFIDNLEEIKNLGINVFEFCIYGIKYCNDGQWKDISILTD